MTQYLWEIGFEWEVFLIEDFFGENTDLWIYLKYGRFGHLGCMSSGR